MERLISFILSIFEMVISFVKKEQIIIQESVESLTRSSLISFFHLKSLIRPQEFKSPNGIGYTFTGIGPNLLYLLKPP